MTPLDNLFPQVGHLPDFAESPSLRLWGRRLTALSVGDRSNNYRTQFKNLAGQSLEEAKPGAIPDRLLQDYPP